jgi:hypothetical protein
MCLKITDNIFQQQLFLFAFLIYDLFECISIIESELIVDFGNFGNWIFLLSPFSSKSPISSLLGLTTFQYRQKQQIRHSEL